MKSFWEEEMIVLNDGYELFRYENQVTEENVATLSSYTGNHWTKLAKTISTEQSPLYC